MKKTSSNISLPKLVYCPCNTQYASNTNSRTNRNIAILLKIGNCSMLKCKASEGSYFQFSKLINLDAIKALDEVKKKKKQKKTFFIFFSYTSKDFQINIRSILD